MPEHHRYLRGMRSWVGFRQTGLAVEREERRSGKSKYSLLRLLKLATDGIFAFSIVALYNAACVSILLWEQRQANSSCAPAVFALLVIVFLVAEQFGVGAIFPFTIATSCSWHLFWD
jgi:hypothetical protein